MLSRQLTLSYRDFQQRVPSWLPQLRRHGAGMDHVRSLSTGPTRTPKWPYSITPQLGLDEWLAIMKPPKVEGSAFLTSLGVRDSLRYLYRHFKVATWQLPSDLYPVYQMMAEQEEIPHHSFPTWDRELVPPEETTSDRLPEDEPTPQVLLVTDPDPFGRQLTRPELGALQRWLINHPQHRLVIDAVYATQVRPELSGLMETQQVIYLHSLTKTHLLPWHFGVMWGPTETLHELGKSVVPPPEEKCTTAYSQMVSHPHQGREQRSWIQEAWEKMKPELQKQCPDWEPVDSYFSRTPISWEQWWEQKLLSIPGSVFDGPEDQSVVSALECLPPDRRLTQRLYHVTRLSNFPRGFDKYTLTYSKQGTPHATFPDQFHLLYPDQLEIGVEKHRGKLEAEDQLLVLETESTETLLPSMSGLGQYLEQDFIPLTRVGLVDPETPFLKNVQWFPVEELYARGMALQSSDLVPFAKQRPRTISLLPIAQGCQAKCPFCFSHASVSDDVKQRRLTPERYTEILDRAREAGAERAVITGGGEPMMFPPKALLPMVQACGERFEKVVMITNGYALGKLEEEDRLKYLLRLQEAGLTVLSISRHGIDAENNAEIMHLDTRSEPVAQTWVKYSELFPTLDLRWVCVLQKGGVDTPERLAQYLDWTVATGVSQICFKELYVSSSVESLYHQYEANQWSREHQVPLVMLTDFLKKQGATRVGELPWGSPVYALEWPDAEGQLQALTVAAYTEPSVYWEATEGVCRSWNLMADGDCFVSLEDRASRI